MAHSVNSVERQAAHHEWSGVTMGILIVVEMRSGIDLSDHFNANDN